MSLLEVKNLTVSFEGRTVFKDLSFNVEKVDYLCILGENGSGKTTLMRCILGFPVKHEGNISYKDLRRRDIGWLPQRSETKKDFPASVGEVVMSGFAGRNRTGLFYSSAQKKQARANMELMEISELKNSSFRELSGGQQQRVLLCRALCAADSVLLLDEPVTGLDAAAQNELYELIKKLHKSGMTVIMITHDVTRSVNVGGKVLHMSDDGYYFGTAEDYVNTDFYKNISEVR